MNIYAHKELPVVAINVTSRISRADGIFVRNSRISGYSIDFKNDAKELVRVQNVSAESAAIPFIGCEVLAVGGMKSADLVITDIAWEPANPVTGAAVMLKAIVKNQGAASTPASVIHGVRFTIDGTPVLWSDYRTDAIAAGESVILVGNEGPDGPATSLSSDSKPIRLDAFGAGSHTITAIVDDVNRIQESDETNNQLSETIALG